MSKSTPATLFLAKAGTPFTAHPCEYDPGAERAGLQAAAALGEPPERVFKTLIAQVDGKPVCAVIPSDRELSLKKLAAAMPGKSGVMIAPAQAEKLTGYKVGGISPFGQRKRIPTFFASEALLQPYIYVNGGQRGLQVRLAPTDAITAAGATTADLVADVR